jgi:hypothetical protein
MQSCLVTHDAKVAAHAERIMFIAWREICERNEVHEMQRERYSTTGRKGYGKDAGKSIYKNVSVLKVGFNMQYRTGNNKMMLQ